MVNIARETWDMRQGSLGRGQGMQGRASSGSWGKEEEKREKGVGREDPFGASSAK